MQDELGVPGEDFTLWARDRRDASVVYELGAKMTVQRPMVIDLHDFYAAHRGGCAGADSLVVIFYLFCASAAARPHPTNNAQPSRGTR